MSNNEHPEGSETHRAVRCTFGPVREMDLVWPPPDADLDACAIVHLEGGDARPQGPEPSPVATAEPSSVAAAEPMPDARARRRLKPTFGDCRDPGVAPRIRPLVVTVQPPPLPVVPPPLPVALVGDPEKAEASEGLAATAIAPDDYEDDDEDDPLGDEPMVLFPLVHAEAAADPEVAGASRSAWLAVFFAAACAFVTVVEYGVIFSLPPEVGTSAAEQPPAPEGVSAHDLAPGVRPSLPADRLGRRREVGRPPAEAIARAPEGRDASAVEASRPAVTLIAESTRTPIAQATRTPDPAPATRLASVAPPQRSTPPRDAAPSPARPGVTPAPAAPSRVAVHVVNRGAVRPPEPRPLTPVRPAVSTTLSASTKPAAAPDAAPNAAPDAAVSSPAPAALAAAPLSAAAAAREPIDDGTAVASPRPVAAVLTETTNADEDDIRSTLKRFRTAYSQLNARAARDVWPSVDARALERAFQSLKSQELRFDRCNLTVTGAKAQAACTGRATYVPRIGDQSPRFTTREWTFELRKADERWTIASARTL